MSTTPRTDAVQFLDQSDYHDPSAVDWFVRADFARELETELAAAKECVAIANRSADDQMHQKREAQTELARLRAEVSEARRAWLGDDYGHLPLIEALEKFRSDSDAESDRADVLYQRSCEVEHDLRADVKRWQAEAEEMSAQRSHNANQAGRLRAELAVAENWVEHHSKHADDLIAENVKLRADLERFTGHGLLDCHAICDQRDAAIARAERVEAERDALAKDKARLDWLSVSDAWFDYPATGAFTPDTMRAAIDAAMKP